MARPKSGIERKRRVLYCASELDNKQLVDLIEGNNTDCSKCAQLSKELSLCAQKLSDLQSSNQVIVHKNQIEPVNVHINENKSAQKPPFTPNYVKNGGVDMESLKAIASGACKSQQESQEQAHEITQDSRLDNHSPYIKTAVEILEKIDSADPQLAMYTHAFIDIMHMLNKAAVKDVIATFQRWINQAQA